jgi:hypothetical protein
MNVPIPSPGTTPPYASLPGVSDPDRRMAAANERAKAFWADAMDMEDPKDAALRVLAAHYEVTLAAAQLLGNEVLALDARLRSRPKNGRPRRALRVVRDSTGHPVQYQEVDPIDQVLEERSAPATCWRCSERPSESDTGMCGGCLRYLRRLAEAEANVANPTIRTVDKRIERDSEHV